MKLTVVEGFKRKYPTSRIKRRRANSPKSVLKKRKRPKTKSLSKLKREADKQFSLYIRQKYADKDGMVKSFTGNEVKHWKEMHCGHYLTRGILALRWNPNNARPQSPAENIWKHGNPIEFRINLVAEIGEDAVKKLESRRKELFKPDRAFYDTTIEHFKSLCQNENKS